MVFPKEDCWRDLISAEMGKNGDSWTNVVHSWAGPSPDHRWDETPPPAPENWLDVRFDAGFGSPEGHTFTLWTDRWVYFPLEYDGAERCGSAPRNPRDHACKHQP